MSMLAPDPPPEDPRRLRIEVARTAERLRTMSLVRLGAPLPDGLTRAALALALAQQLADEAADLTGDPRRRLPDGLAPATAGDVLAVCGHDLAEAVAVRRADQAAGRASAGAVEALVLLRRDL
jgi:hypothetical protein